MKYSHSGGNTCSVEVDIWKNIIESQTLSYLPNTAGLQINTEETIESPQELLQKKESPQENTNTFRKANYHTRGHEGSNREQSIGLSVARLFEPPGGELTRPGSRTDVRPLIKPPVRPGTVASPIIQKKKALSSMDLCDHLTSCIRTILLPGPKEEARLNHGGESQSTSDRDHNVMPVNRM